MIPIDSFIALDVETTGFAPSQHRMIEVAAVRFTRDAVIETFDTLIDAQCPIPSHATAAHGITRNDLIGAPKSADALDQLIRFIGRDNALIIAHKATFDAGFLVAEMIRSAIPVPSWLIVDSLPMLKERHWRASAHSTHRRL